MFKNSRKMQNTFTQHLNNILLKPIRNLFTHNKSQIYTSEYTRNCISIDKVRLILSIDDMIRKENSNTLPDRIKDPIEMFSELSINLSNTHHIITKYNIPMIIGRIKNLRILISPTHLIISGSINKFKYGNNIEELKQSDMNSVIQELESFFPIKLTKARITYIEIARNICTKNPVEDYFDIFAKYKQSIRNCYYYSTLYFSQGNRVICIYNKLRELKDKRQKSPCSDGYILRIEMRLKKNVKAFLGLKIFTLNDLANKEIWELLNHKFKNEYNNIKTNKIIKQSYDKNYISSITNQKNILFIKHVLDKFNTVHNYINHEIDLNPEMNNLLKSRSRNQMYKLFSNSDYFETNPMETELRNKLFGE